LTSCVCNDNVSTITSSIEECANFCSLYGGMSPLTTSSSPDENDEEIVQGTTYGINNKVYGYIVGAHIVFWILFLVMCIGILRFYCGEDKPAWLSPLVVIFLFLSILFCWFPIAGFIFLALLLITLIVYVYRQKEVLSISKFIEM